MTHQQAQLFEYLRDYTRINRGASPSLDEMAAALGLKSKSGVHRLLTGLEMDGRITRRRFHARAIRVIDRGEPTVDELRGIVWRLIEEEGATRTVAALSEMATEIARQVGAGGV